MDSNIHLDIGCQHRVFEPSLIERSMTPSPITHQSCINFNFHVNIKSSIVIQNMDGTIEPFAELDPTSTHISVELKFKDFLLMSEIREGLFGPLVSLHMLEEERCRLVQCAWDAAAAACFESLRTPHCVDMDIDFDLVMEHEYVFISCGRDDDDHCDYSMLSDCGGERSGWCCICLEDLFDDGRVLCTPCLHVFHGDCIKNWLAAAPSCPLCRSQINVTS